MQAYQWLVVGQHLGILAMKIGAERLGRPKYSKKLMVGCAVCPLCRRQFATEECDRPRALASVLLKHRTYAYVGCVSNQSERNIKTRNLQAWGRCESGLDTIKSSLLLHPPMKRSTLLQRGSMTGAAMVEKSQI